MLCLMIAGGLLDFGELGALNLGCGCGAGAGVVILVGVEGGEDLGALDGCEAFGAGEAG